MDPSSRHVGPMAHNFGSFGQSTHNFVYIEGRLFKDYPGSHFQFPRGWWDYMIIYCKV